MQDKSLTAQISVLKQALEDSEKLTAELIKDKDRVGRTLKKDAPHIYRKLQLDVFTDFSIYKQKALVEMNDVLLQTSKKYLQTSKMSQDVQTNFRDVKNHIVKQY